MSDYNDDLNLEINEELSAEMKAFFESRAALEIGGAATSHNSNNTLITHDE